MATLVMILGVTHCCTQLTDIGKMSDYNNSMICSQAIKQNDVMFSLISLKQKLLVKAQECDNCHIETKEWTIISNCHHKICQHCINGPTYFKDTCPKCELKFNPEVHVTTSSEMRKQYSEMEQVVWNIMALENGTLTEVSLGEGSSSNNSSETLNFNLSAKTSRDEQNSELLSSSNHCVPESFTEFVGKIQEIQLSEKASSEELFQDLSFVEFNSAENEELSSDVDNCINEPNAGSTYSSSSKSEDDIIEGTPEKFHDLNPVSSTSDGIVELRKKIVLSHSSLNDVDIVMLEKFLDFFNVEANLSWSDSVTHLVVKTVNGNLCFRTRKYFNALLSHCCIVSLDWIKDCLLLESLLPEINYMPFDSSEQPAALMSWKVGQGFINSPMEWTKDCILFFHHSVEQSNDSYSDIIAFIKKAGFVLANDLKEFNEKFKIRAIIFDPPLNDLMEDVKGWKFEHDALLLSLEWLLECLGQYRFVPIRSEYQIM